MAGIYSRDNINYASMVQNAINNRVHRIERDSEYAKARAERTAQMIKEVPSRFADAYFSNSDYETDPDEYELKKLEEERQALLDAEKKLQETNHEDYSQYLNTVNSMNNYHPNVPTPNTEGPNPYAIPGNPNASQAEWFQYQMAMGKLFGGRT